MLKAGDASERAGEPLPVAPPKRKQKEKKERVPNHGCPFCDSTRTRINNNYNYKLTSNPSKTRTRRKRYCLACLRKFQTDERYIPESDER
jgi:hypothetical protein